VRTGRDLRTRLGFAAVFGTAVALGCNEPTALPPPPTSDLLPPLTGDVTATTATTGADLDPDGYTVTLDLLQSKSVATNGSTTFSGVLAGNHMVELSGVASNCTVTSSNPQTVTLASSSVTASFTVSCAATTGNLAVTTNTTGSNLDPDGYTVTADGGPSQTIATNGSVTFSGLATGNHQVTLSGMAANCSVSGANPQTVNVPAGGTATTTFSVSCTAATGVRLTGLGQIGNGSPTLGNNVQTFDFDVRSDLTGRLLYTDYTEVRSDGTAGWVRVDPNTPGTRITAFRTSSTACADPSRGVEFDGTGFADTGEPDPNRYQFVDFTAGGCDNGPANSGSDFFGFFIAKGYYYRYGTVTSGDIVKSGP